MNPGSMVAIHTATTAAAAAKARTKVLDTFRTHDATAPTRARTLADIGLSADDAVGKLIEAGVIRPVDSRHRPAPRDPSAWRDGRSRHATDLLVLGLGDGAQVTVEARDRLPAGLANRR